MAKSEGQHTCLILVSFAIESNYRIVWDGFLIEVSQMMGAMTPIWPALGLADLTVRSRLAALQKARLERDLDCALE
jgi:hypothetical protein